jgi:threonylcarbamoyladenosine tRNA methylthiotransferase MtaB
MTARQPRIITFGCRLNSYESEAMKSLASNAGYGYETIIFNTCAVTGEAERQVRQAIRKARRENPEARIVVTGCAAQIGPDSYATMEEVDFVIGNDVKLRAETWANLGSEKVHVTDIMSIRETAGHLIEGMEGMARAFMQVQTGCDHRCTFCIIPYGRGNSRSVPLKDIVVQARKLVEAGYREIVLTGVDITSYGPDLPGNPLLGEMITELLEQVPELKRLRLSSIDPVEIDESLWRLIAEEPRLMPHLHLSLQAGDDMVLKRMKRRHSRQDVIDICKRARDLRPDIVFGADIIAGFPTETEEMFANTMDIVRECDITLLHVFPFSPRPGTPAAKMPQVPVKVRKERAARLRALGEEQLQNKMKQFINKEMEAIVEETKTARTDHFLKSVLDKECNPGEVIKIRAAGMDDDALLGEVMA